MKRETIYIWCGCPYILSSLLYKISHNPNNKYQIFTQSSCIPLFVNGLPRNIKLKSFESINVSFFQRFFHAFLLWLFEDEKMSNMWTRDRSNLVMSFGPRFAKRLVSSLLSLNSQRKFYERIMNLTPGFKFQNQNFFVYSLCYQQFLFVHKTCSVTYVVDSWDHLYKYPIFFNPKVTLCWNKHIGRELIRVHCIPSVGYFNTTRFELPKQTPQANKSLLDSKLWLYPLNYSYNDSVDNFLFEVRIINELARILKNHFGNILHVKLKPISHKEDFIRISQIENVNIILTQNNNLSKMEYLLEKGEIIDKMALYIGFATTFILDAAFNGVPIFPLNSFYSGDKMLAKFSENDHIKNFILPLVSDVFGIDKMKSQLHLLEELNEHSLMKSSTAFSLKLKKMHLPDSAANNNFSLNDLYGM